MKGSDARKQFDRQFSGEITCFDSFLRLVAKDEDKARTIGSFIDCLNVMTTPTLDILKMLLILGMWGFKALISLENTLRMRL